MLYLSDFSVEIINRRRRVYVDEKNLVIYALCVPAKQKPMLSVLG